MIGSKLGEETGKVTGSRILQGEGGRFVKMEVSFQAEGTLLGVKGMNVGTYVVYERVPGQMYGEGQGIFMTKDGGVIWNGIGVGAMTGQGLGVKWAAALTFQTNVQSLSRLNGVIGAVEHETDAANNVKTSTWEWKH